MEDRAYRIIFSNLFTHEKSLLHASEGLQLKDPFKAAKLCFTNKQKSTIIVILRLFETCISVIGYSTTQLPAFCSMRAVEWQGNVCYTLIRTMGIVFFDHLIFISNRLRTCLRLPGSSLCQCRIEPYSQLQIHLHLCSNLQLSLSEKYFSPKIL